MGWWKSKVAHQMLSCFCIFRNIKIFTPSWIMVPLALSLLFSSYYKLVGFMFFSSLLFTSLSLLLSTFLLLMWKRKAEGVGFSFEKTPQHGRESVAAVAPTLMHKNLENIETQAKESEEVLCLSTSEDYEKVDHTLSDEGSNGTISDEDSLIEIELPSGHFVGHNRHHHHHNQNKQESNSKYNNNNCCSLQQKKRELSSAREALFKQQSLMEFLAEFNEMNEEDNLIEIDIAMGSIKCSRFEIEA